MKTIGKDITVRDVVEGVSEGVLSQIPYVGAFVQAVEKVKGNVLQRRYESWQEEVGKRLSQLEDEVREHIGESECFATTLIKATELAAQTNTIKRQYLANAVIYSAEHHVEEDNLIMLLNDIAKYTVSHFKVLTYMQSPGKYKNGREYFSGSIMSYFEDSYPSFDKSRETLILNDLYNDGLIDTNSNGMVSSSGMEVKRTTSLGDLFISFFGLKKEDYE